MKTKIDYISDIHLDFICTKANGNSEKLLRIFKTLTDYLEITKENAGEVLLIPGDLGHYHYQNTEFLKYLKTFYKHICIVPGNHDLYLISKQQAKQFNYNSFNRLQAMKDFCESQDGLHYLDGNVVEINGVKIGGSGMFWDSSYFEMMKGYAPSNHELKKLYYENMNDVNYINTSGSYKQKTFDPFEYFDSQYKKLQQIKNADIMISHYSPIVPYDINPKFIGEITNTFYYFNGEQDIKRINPKYWFFGHVHDKYQFIKDSTCVISNPLGYPGENFYVTIQSVEL